MAEATASSSAGSVHVVRGSAGRIRVHLSQWDGSDVLDLEKRISAIPGVRDVTARPSTRNVLIEYDEARTGATSILEHPELAEGRRDTGPAVEPSRPAPAAPRREAQWISGILREQAGRFGRARIAVRGIDRDSQLARRVVEILQARPEVKRAVASATTGRVLVEFSDRVSSIQDLLAELSSLELPETPGGDRPSHPLDPSPIIQSGSRAIGAALGLGALAVQRLVGGPGPAQAPAVVAGTIGLIDAAPPVREGLRSVLGRDRAQLLFGGAAIVSLTLSGSPLGLLVSGSTALRVFLEARLRRDAWREYERRLHSVAGAQPGSVVRLDAGARVPLGGRVIEGVGTVVGLDGLPDGATPGAVIPAGATVLRGPLVVELEIGRGFSPQPRPADPRPDALQRYLALLGPVSLGYACLHALTRGSPGALFTGLLLVNARPAVIGADAADTGASARVLRAGVTVVGTRPERVIRRPDVVLIDSPRVLADGVEQTRVTPAGDHDRIELTEIVSAMTAAEGSPWGKGPRPSTARQAEESKFDGSGVSALVAGRRWRLEPPRSDEEGLPEVQRAIEAGEQALILREQDTDAVVAYVHLRPCLAPGLDELHRYRHRHGIDLILIEQGDRRAARAVARRAGIPLILEADLVDLVRARQRLGDRVAVLSDSPRAAEAFEACDLAIALSSGRSSRFQARADLLAPGLAAVAAVLDAGTRRDEAIRRSVGLSLLANAAGAAWGLQDEVGVLRASHATYAGALAAMAAGWERLRGGRRSKSVINRLSDPRPERWGALDAESVLRAMDARPEGLTDAQALERREQRVGPTHRNAFLSGMAEQLESPLMAILGAGALVSLATGAVADVAIIGAVVVANAAVGAWQERQAGQAAQALERLGAATARVVREGCVREIVADEVVRGDILLLQSGDRVVADARLLEADALELDEAALTGESLPVAKSPDADELGMRIVLEGSDVTVGVGRAVVVAVGERTRLGATAAALSVEDARTSPLGERLDTLFRQGMPVVAAGGLLVTLAGIAWGGSPLAQLAIGASVAVAAVPEGLPLLAGVAEAAVARRLSERSAFVRRLSSVEGLGRVDVVCCDKTGTLTRGKLEVTLLADLSDDLAFGREQLTDGTREVLLCAALASPPPANGEPLAHATDRAVLAAAEGAALAAVLGESTRRDEAPFDPVRALHATAVENRICVKGAAEVLVPRCRYRKDADGSRAELGEGDLASLLARAEELSGRGLRVLMVAEGPADAAVEDPRELTALGFVGISDPPRPGAAAALERCRAAGIRVIMLTGDHPATARKIADELGLPVGPGSVLTGDQLAQVENGELKALMQGASVVARITPIDKLRIIESLRQAGHTVAMTGDGVNDAPALRLADVGVAMGRGGTEVARQAADLVLGDDRIETLTDALLEGRSLWQNLHRSLGLLLGGNLGEVGLMAGAAIVGRGAVLGARQILAINLVTDVLPAVAVAIQPPRERNLHSISREGSESFDRQLRHSILRRGVATAAPALAALLLAPVLGAPAPTVAFGSIIVTQLAQTLWSGQPGERTTRPVMAAVAGSTAVLAGSLTLPPLRKFLALPALTPQSLLLVALTAPAAVAVAAALAPASEVEQHPGRRVTLGR